jgi:hypothetical protein
MAAEMSLQCSLVDRRELESNVVYARSMPDRRAGASAPERAINRDEIDQRPASAQLRQAELWLFALDAHSQDAAIKGEGPLAVENAKNDVIDSEYLEHCLSGLC